MTLRHHEKPRHLTTWWVLTLLLFTHFKGEVEEVSFLKSKKFAMKKDRGYDPAKDPGGENNMSPEKFAQKKGGKGENKTCDMNVPLVHTHFNTIVFYRAAPHWVLMIKKQR